MHVLRPGRPLCPLKDVAHQSSRGRWWAEPWLLKCPLDHWFRHNYAVLGIRKLSLSWLTLVLMPTCWTWLLPLSWELVGRCWEHPSTLLLWMVVFFAGLHTKLSLFKWTCQVTTTKLSFHLIHAPHQPVILGYPWLRRHNPHIDWASGTIMQWSTHCHAVCLSEIYSVTCFYTCYFWVSGVPKDYMDIK